MRYGPSRRLIAYLIVLLQPATQERYAKAQQRFTDCLAETENDKFWCWTDEEQDYFLAGFVQDLRDYGAHRQAALDTIACVQKVYAGRRRFRAAYSVVDGWEKEVPAGRRLRCLSRWPALVR